MAGTHFKYATAGEAEVFYREAGPKDSPVVLLLHGFPASSFQFRNLIPILSSKYRVIAPDLPGFGFTEVPNGYKYTFDNAADTIEVLLDALSIKKFVVYIFDYGAPTGLRLALRRPQAVAGIISQNGNAYNEGFGEEFWAPIKKYWADKSSENAAAITPSYDFVKYNYTAGAPDVDALAPEAWWLDWALIERPGNKQVQLDYFYDYQTNVDLYPQFHEYFRKSQVPLLAVWGEKDPIFVPPGAEAYKRDLPKATVKLIDAGHFALEHRLEEIAGYIQEFLKTVY